MSAVNCYSCGEPLNSGDSCNTCWEDRHASLRVAELEAEVARLRDALTPSALTKAAYVGEFKFYADPGAPYTVPWTTVKEIMAAILKEASK